MKSNSPIPTDLGLEGLRKKYRSEPALPFSDDNQSVITAATLPEILMASIQRQHGNNITNTR